MGNTWLAKFFKGDLGWKTVWAAVALAVLVLLRSFDVITQEQFEAATKLAEGLGLIGLRDALAKLKG